jgi:hypothetical protein
LVPFISSYTVDFTDTLLGSDALAFSGTLFLPELRGLPPGLPLRPFWKPPLPVELRIVNLFDLDLKYPATQVVQRHNIVAL